MINEIATTIGKTVTEVEGMDKVDLANALAKAHFNFGFAVSWSESQAEVEQVRKKGREQLLRMEKTSEKQHRAQNRIWELKQIITIAVALAEGGYPINQKNLNVVLAGSNFPLLSPERKQDILRTAQAVFEDKHVRRFVSQLVNRFREVRAQKKEQAESA
jgi:hypothetical protein